MKKLISILLTAALVISLFVTVFAVENISSGTVVTDSNISVDLSNEDARSALIYDYFSAINAGDYSEIANMSPSAIRDMMVAIYSNDTNQSNNIGLFNIASITADHIRWDMAEDLCDYIDVQALEAYTNYEVALVEATVACNVEDERLHDGTNYLCITSVEESGGVYISDMVLVDSQLGSSLMADASLYGIDTPISSNILYLPQTIKVYRANQYSGESADVIGTIETVDFDNYCYICLRGEFGANSYNETAREAVAIAVKCFAFHRYLHHYDLAKGWHIIDSGTNTGNSGDYAAQDYNPTLELTTKVINAVDNTWDYFVLDANNRLIPTFHLAGTQGVAGQKNYGILYQKGAQFLAETEGYSRDKILGYYYDRGSSTYYNTLVAIGDVSIHTHTITTESTTSTSHTMKCSTCGNTQTGAHEYSENSMFCQICHYRP